MSGHVSENRGTWNQEEWLHVTEESGGQGAMMTVFFAEHIDLSLSVSRCAVFLSKCPEWRGNTVVQLRVREVV